MGENPSRFQSPQRPVENVTSEELISAVGSLATEGGKSLEIAGFVEN
jgi:hypothetical protein